MSGAGGRYIVVEGPIGVGKTSLARRLAASLGAELLLEAAEENPFLERFYRDPRGAALPTQLAFLIQRVQQLEALRQGDLFRGDLVADYLLAKDRLFAEVTLDADELRLYEAFHRRLAPNPPPPDLVIYLQAPVGVLLARIARRGRPWERGIEAGYLERLAEAYTRFFHHYDEAPLLIVNAAEIDLVDSEADYEALLRHVRATRHGRHYLNPAPMGL
ncbi:deoxynucleoside kinase [Inmirania thermothiophila]|uniref:Deoxyadenosine/deoxycytidine kinase n=1 Tax=Inmirania thermothiophila TaxID=1750597 RepID=A0A3N1Y6E2_9GAMM|nr:deoxynucleoside kinase [Inmirania thermothiophila]ROR32877.1 deoxyadenosine/deoxycytidine kinase [Inmirania thermothiophila]